MNFAGRIALGLVGLSACSAATPAPAALSRSCSVVWSAAPQRPVDQYQYPGAEQSFGIGTLQQTVRLAHSVRHLRVLFSNRFGTRPLVIGDAGVRRTGGGPSAPLIRLSFSSARSAVVPAGGERVSDVIAFDAKAGDRIAISSFFPQAPGVPQTVHLQGLEALRGSPSVDAVSAAELPQVAKLSPRYFLARVDACDDRPVRTIVTLGDSITDGTGSTAGADARYPDALARRLVAAGRSDLTVANMGIDGNRLLHGGFGDSALARLERDVLGVPGVGYLIVLEGINDIYLPEFTGNPAERVTAERIIGAYRTIIVRAHAAGIKVAIGTLTPDLGAERHYKGSFSEAGERTRQRVNRWIRTSGSADAIIDFDRALRDPGDPRRLNAAYDSGDQLHPNDRGYEVMAATIDMGFFRGDAPSRRPKER